jgi:hypothetical protein
LGNGEGGLPGEDVADRDDANGGAWGPARGRQPECAGGLGKLKPWPGRCRQSAGRLLKSERRRRWWRRQPEQMDGPHRGAQIEAPREVIRACGRPSEDGGQGRGPRRGGGRAAGRG